LKNLILLVDDNEDILINMQVTLEFNNYEVLTAKNGSEGIDLLSKLSKLPDLIISDIMMPDMNGYDFFRTVSDNLNWSTIPFIFLTARTSPRDVRFGKMLGVDDYLTKPFDKDDLLAIIKGKIDRNKKIKSITEDFKEKYSKLKISAAPSVSDEEKSQVLVFLMFWDDRIGPVLDKKYPPEFKLTFSIDKVGTQLFNSVVSIYGQGEIKEPQSILLDIKNIDRRGFIYFDSYTDKDVRGGEQSYMLGLISPKINYFESLKIKEIFNEISSQIKNRKDWKIADYWKKLYNILATPSL
jgi:CheY-like chemotaxis protein